MIMLLLYELYMSMNESTLEGLKFKDENVNIVAFPDVEASCGFISVCINNLFCCLSNITILRQTLFLKALKGQ